MEKLAETEAPIHELLARRWSPRAFADRLVELDKLLSLFEAARWAPSSNNEQPWAFLVATKDDPKNFEAMLGVLVEFNRGWANRAAVLILTFAHTQFEKDGTPNRHGFYDLGQAAISIALQATAMGLMAHQMAGFSVEAARERFAVPPGWEPASVIAIGYPGELNTLSDRLQQREIAPRQRKPLEEFVFSGTWGHPAQVIASSEKTGAGSALSRPKS